MHRTFFFIFVIVLIALALFSFWYFRESRHVTTINSFTECAEHGYLVMESYPRQCMTPDGRSFVEEIEEVPSADVAQDMIRITTPQSGERITSPLVIKGEARGTWFFEASFPVRILLEDGSELLVAPAQALGEWMTEGFVPFEATLVFSQPVPQNGTLVLMKDNPSGLPEFDKSISIPITF